VVGRGRGRRVGLLPPRRCARRGRRRAGQTRRTSPLWPTTTLGPDATALPEGYLGVLRLRRQVPA
jgi:hypothetical protein